MKKVLPVFFCLCLFLCACGSSEQTVEPLASAFSCEGDITLGELSLSVSLVKNAQQNYSVKLLEPKEVAGFEFVFKGDAVSLKFLGLEIGLPEGIAPSSSAVSSLIWVLEQLSGNEQLIGTLVGDAVQVNGTGAMGSYRASFVTKPKKMITIEIPESEFKAVIHSFSN